VGRAKTFPDIEEAEREECSAVGKLFEGRESPLSYKLREGGSQPIGLREVQEYQIQKNNRDSKKSHKEGELKGREKAHSAKERTEDQPTTIAESKTGHLTDV